MKLNCSQIALMKCGIRESDAALTKKTAEYGRKPASEHGETTGKQLLFGSVPVPRLQNVFKSAGRDSVATAANAGDRMLTRDCDNSGLCCSSTVAGYNLGSLCWVEGNRS
jgi:hypothetical protein